MSFSMSGEKPQLDNYVVWGATVEGSCRHTGKRPKASTKWVSGLKNLTHEERLKWFV